MSVSKLREREHASIFALGDGVELLAASFDRHTYERHMHPTYAIGVTLRGVQRFWCRGTTHDSVAGRMLLIPPGEVHDGESGAPGGYRYRMFYLPIDTVTAVLRDAWARDVPSLDTRSPLLDDPPLAAGLNAAWEALWSKEVLAGEVLRDRVLTALASHASRVPLPRHHATHAPGLRAVRDYLHEHLHSAVRVSELAAIAELSRFQLTRQFRRAFGLPLHAYHLQIRLTEAKRRLQLGTPIAEVAAALGFADQSHFHRRFRGFFGITPGAARRSNTRPDAPI